MNFVDDGCFLISIIIDWVVGAILQMCDSNTSFNCNHKGWQEYFNEADFQGNEHFDKSSAPSVNLLGKGCISKSIIANTFWWHLMSNQQLQKLWQKDVSFVFLAYEKCFWEPPLTRGALMMAKDILGELNNIKVYKIRVLTRKSKNGMIAAGRDPKIHGKETTE